MKHIIFVGIAFSILACSSSAPKDKGSVEAVTPAASEPAKEVKKVEAKKEIVAKTAGEVTCQLKSEVRKIAVSSTEGGGCEVMYTKAGEAASVASAMKGSSHCQQVQEKIKGNLAAAGFACE